jgi:hypothetical protein
MEPFLLTDEDVMDALRLSARAVAKLRRTRKLPCVFVEGHRRYRVQDVAAFAAGLRPRTADAPEPTVIPGPDNPRRQKRTA